MRNIIRRRVMRIVNIGIVIAVRYSTASAWMNFII